MADTIRQLVVDAVASRLRLISKANGYSRDIGDRVFDHLILAPNKPTPCVALYDQTEDVDPKEKTLNNQDTRALTLGVIFVDSYSGDYPSDVARVFLGEIQRAIPREFQLTVPLQGQGVATGVTTVRAQEVSTFLNHSDVVSGRIYGQINYELRYRTAVNQPDAL